MIKERCIFYPLKNIFHIFSTDRVFFLAVVAVIALNIIIRYPVVPHQLGVDSFFIHYLAGVIGSEGKIPWLLSILSLFGLYPYSYPSGIPILLSELHLVTGCELEVIIYLFALVMGLLGLGTSYLLAGEFFQGRGKQLLFACIYSLSPLALKYTIWTASTRGAFLMLLPLALWSLIRFCRTWSIPYLLVTILLYSVLWSVHRLFTLLIPITLFCILLYKGKNLIPVRILKEHERVCMILVLLAIVITFILYALQFVNFAIAYDNSGDYWGLRYFSFAGIPGWVNYLMGNLIELGARFVLLIPLAIIGLFYFLQPGVVKTNEWFLLVVTLFFIPFIGLSIQIYQILLPFICLLATYGIFVLLRNRKGSLFTVAAYSFLIAILILSSVGTLVYRDISVDSSGFHNYADEQTVSVAFFLRDNTPPSEGIQGVGSLYIAAYSGKNATIPEEISNTIAGDTPDIKNGIRMKKIDLFNVHSWESFIKYPFFVENEKIVNISARYIVSGSHPAAPYQKQYFQVYDNGFHTAGYTR